MKREISIPDPVVAVHRATGEKFKRMDEENQKVVEDDPWTMSRFLAAYILSHKDFTGKGNKKLQAMRYQAQIYRALDEAEANGGKSMTVSQEAWERMKAVVEGWTEEDPPAPKPGQAPPPAWNEHLMYQLLPFCEAILDAKTVE